jgi:hypothetical protein
MPGEKKRKLNHYLDDQLEFRRAVNGLEGLRRRWVEPLLLFVYPMKKEDGTTETISLLNTEIPDELAPAAHVIERTSETLEALSNGNRLRVLIELFGGEKHPKELVSATGLKGGALYHHRLDKCWTNWKDRQGENQANPYGWSPDEPSLGDLRG